MIIAFTLNIHQLLEFFFTFPCNYHTCMDIDVEIIEYINLNNYNNLLYILSMCMYPWDWYIDLFSIVLY